jgi:hypothetical protein
MIARTKATENAHREWLKTLPKSRFADSAPAWEVRRAEIKKGAKR